MLNYSFLVLYEILRLRVETTILFELLISFSSFHMYGKIDLSYSENAL